MENIKILVDNEDFKGSAGCNIIKAGNMTYSKIREETFCIRTVENGDELIYIQIVLHDTCNEDIEIIIGNERLNVCDLMTSYRIIDTQDNVWHTWRDGVAIGLFNGMTYMRYDNFESLRGMAS